MTLSRRRLLQGLGGVAAFAGAGCLQAPRSSGTGCSHAASPPAPDLSDVTLPVPDEELESIVPADAIPSVVDPAFASDWSGVSDSLDDDEMIVGVARAGKARAYPLKLLRRFEVVNDDLGGPLLVTYCPLCDSGLVAKRLVDGQETRFGVSGSLWRSNLVMYDARTFSLWSQLLATAIRGPKTGETLTQLPSTITTWELWRADNPDTVALLPPPHSTLRQFTPTDHVRTEYSDFESAELYQQFGSPEELRTITLVVGVTAGEAARAYPLGLLERDGPINDRLGGQPVLVALDRGVSTVAYDRRVEGTTLEFEAVDRSHVKGGGSTWRLATGRAVSGPHEGQCLEALGSWQMRWHAWQDFHSDTDVYGVA